MQSRKIILLSIKKQKVRFWQMARQALAVFVAFVALSFAPIFAQAQAQNTAQPTQKATNTQKPIEYTKARTLTIAISQNAIVTSPQGYGANQLFAQNLVFEGLTRLGKNGEIEPSLAESWEILDGGKKYIFHLRKGVIFSNGEAFDASAAKKNFDALIKMRARHSWSALSEVLDSVAVLDSHTLAITLRAPYAPTLSELALIRPYRFIAPSCIPDSLDITSRAPSKPIGTGAYMLAESILGSGDEFRANPHYWDASRAPYFTTIRTKVILEPNSKLIALKTGLVDLVYGRDQISSEIFKEVAQGRGGRDLRAYLSPAIYTTALGLNPSNEFLADKRVRQAIAQAIDKDALTKGVYGEYQSSASALFAPNSKLTKIELAKIAKSSGADSSADSSTARKLLESSGFTRNKQGAYEKGGKILRLKLEYVGNDPAQKMMGEILQAQLAKVGVELVLSANDESIYSNKIKNGAFDMCFTDTWGAPYEPIVMLNSMRFKGHSGYALLSPLPQGSKIFADIAALIATLESKLAAPTHAILREIYEASVFVPLTYQRNKAIAKDWISGLENMGVAAFEIPLWELGNKRVK